MAKYCTYSGKVEPLGSKMSSDHGHGNFRHKKNKKVESGDTPLAGLIVILGFLLIGLISQIGG